MPSFCAVLNCSDKYGHADNISFHKFPFKRRELLQKWLDFAQRGADWQPSRWSAICSRHFHEEDFNCVAERKTLKKTAVPSVRLAESHDSKIPEQRAPEEAVLGGLPCVRKAMPVPAEASQQDEGDSEEENQQRLQQTLLNAPLYSSPNAPKVKCRLCGHVSSAVVTFSTNFEIYGMIQKCFPTLNIQKDDSLPKEMCRVCLRRLENFSRFIDKVLETQSELQRKFRSEKSSSSNNKLPERQLKIKQEPVVRVKQEVAEGFESFLSDDLDMGIEDGCEQEQEPAAVEQKYDFCDFPILNTQDIINNCDIMEIINLDDPFINIPDDDANTNCDNTEQMQLPVKRPLPSAHELLQAHLLIEEHNYAYAAEDLKEEWQIKNTYKTEKIEGYEPEDMMEDAGQADEDFPTYGQEEDATDPLTTAAEAATQATAVENAESRFAKPIVTSVSALAETRLPLAVSHTVETSKLMVTAVKNLPSMGTPPRTHTKPNIVVLNESIVKSSSAFQLHTCTCCHLKFFSVESLNQHYAMVHNQLPMVSVPSANLWDTSGGALGQVEGCKIEKEYGQFVPTQCGTLGFGQMHGEHMGEVGSEKIVDSVNQTSGYAAAPAADSNDLPRTSVKGLKSQIKILEMQQTFVRQHDHYTSSHQSAANFPASRTHGNASTPPAAGKTMPLPEQTKDVTESPSDAFCQRTNGNTCAAMPPARQPLNLWQPSNKLKNFKSRKKCATPPSDMLAANYLQLRRRYRQLQRQCKNLQVYADLRTKLTTHRDEQSAQQQQQQQPAKCCYCRVCRQQFAGVHQLLQHQRQCDHHVRKPRTRFAASCCGCEKFFRSKLALRNHMRYICQALPLRWLKLQMQTFKCRCCRRCTFNHWRLCRRHELRCKRKSAKRRIRKQNKMKSKAQQTHDNWPKQRVAAGRKVTSTPTGAKPARQYVCRLCEKHFANANCLSQHSITHTSQCTHKCGLCERVFKRRNGLTQHMKGYHLQLKPYECPVCRHCYALKCDMLRCRHSLRRIAGTAEGHLTAMPQTV